MFSSRVKRSSSLSLHNTSRLWKEANLMFHWCLYNRPNITYSLMDMNWRALGKHVLTDILRFFFICAVCVIWDVFAQSPSTISSRVQRHMSLVRCANTWDIELTTRRYNHIHTRPYNILYCFPKNILRKQMLGKLFFPPRFVDKLDLQSINKYKTTT